MFLNINDGKLYVETQMHPNETTPPLILISGGPGFSHMTYKIRQSFLEENFNIIYYDPRGCGLSSGFESSMYNIWNDIDDIESIRSHYGYEKISILGTSYGSMTGLGYATKYSQHIHKLILVAGASSYKFLDQAKINLHHRGTLEQQEICDKFLWGGNFSSQSDIDDFFSIMMPLYSKKVASSPTQTVTSDPRIQCSYQVLNSAFKNKFWNFNFYENLKDIDCEALIMSGRDDWINAPLFADEMRNGIKKSHLVHFDSGHAIHLDQPSQYIRNVLDFLKG